MGKLRNPWLAAIIGLMVTAAALYLNWVMDAFSILQLDTLPFSPKELFKSLEFLLDSGWFSLDSNPTSYLDNIREGGLLALWIVEGLGLLLTTVLGSWILLNGTVFCENCNKAPTNKKHWSGRAPLSASEKTAIDQGELGFLPDLGKVSLGEDRTNFDFYHCDECGKFNTMTVYTKVFEENSKGERTSRIDFLRENVLIDQLLYERFLAAMAKKE